MESFSDEELSRQLSEASEDSFASANDEFLPYDQSIEPIATEEEAAEYAELVAQEEEEEETLWSRFSGEDAVVNWCQCSNCSLEFVVKHEECRCCKEVNRCVEKNGGARDGRLYFIASRFRRRLPELMGASNCRNWSENEGEQIIHRYECLGRQSRKRIPPCCGIPTVCQTGVGICWGIKPSASALLCLQ